MEISLLRSINEIPADLFADLEIRSLFETREWLSVNEDTFVGEPAITAEIAGGRLRSAIVWRVLDARSVSPYHNVSALLRRWDPDMPDLGDGWTLNCTGAGLHSSMLSAPGVSFSADRLRAHVDAAMAFRARPPVMVGVNFMGLVDVSGISESLAALGFCLVQGYRRATLDLPGADYADYLIDLNSKCRANARKDRRLYQDLGESVRLSSGPVAAGEDIVRLQAVNLEKYRLPPDPDSLRARHRKLLAAFPADSLVIRSMAGDRCTGFCMFFRYGHHLHALFAGFDPQPGHYGPYFECLFHSAIGWAYQNGVQEIDYGIGSGKTILAKKGRGCAIGPVSSWYATMKGALCRSVI
jgi:Acetyltransferase (GNAT) domain